MNATFRQAGHALRRWFATAVPLGLPRGLLGMLALVVMTECAIARRAEYLMTFDQMSYRVSERAAQKKAPGRDLLCFGDSLVKLGVVPRLVEARSGERTFNLALGGAQPISSYYLWKHALEAGAKPRAVLVDFTPWILREPTSRNEQQLPFLLRNGEVVEFAWEAKDASLLGRMCLSVVLPSARFRLTIRQFVTETVEGEPTDHRWQLFAGLRNWDVNDGAQVMMPAKVVQKAEDVVRTLLTDTRLEQVNLRYMQRFLDLAAQEGVTVYWILTPFNTPARDEYIRQGFQARQGAFIRSIQAKYPNLVVLDGMGLNYDAGHFNDAVHLGTPGAYDFSLALGETLRRHRGTRSGDRWVHIRDTTGPHDQEHLEDIVASAVAQGKRLRATR